MSARFYLASTANQVPAGDLATTTRSHIGPKLLRPLRAEQWDEAEAVLRLLTTQSRQHLVGAICSDHSDLTEDALLFFLPHVIGSYRVHDVLGHASAGTVLFQEAARTSNHHQVCFKAAKYASEHADQEVVRLLAEKDDVAILRFAARAASGDLFRRIFRKAATHEPKPHHALHILREASSEQLQALKAEDAALLLEHPDRWIRLKVLAELPLLGAALGASQNRSPSLAQ